MTLAEAITRFLDHASQNDSTVHPQPQSGIHDQALLLLTYYFSTDSTLSEITPSRLRDFLSRWYVEKASGSKPNDSKSGERDAHSTASRILQALNAQPTEPHQVPEPLDLLNSLAEFFKWADQQAGADQAAEISRILIELRRSLPRALEITNSLTRSFREHGGAFHFPEFLTSFEEGGSSQYDIDVPGNVGAIDGYFRIIRVEGSSVEAEELISEARVWPIVFPSEVAALLDDGYIINLELVRKPEGWQIAGCGFAYPPGTEI
jgi:hypothetical protein